MHVPIFNNLKIKILPPPNNLKMFKKINFGTLLTLLHFFTFIKNGLFNITVRPRFMPPRKVPTSQECHFETRPKILAICYFPRTVPFFHEKETKKFQTYSFHEPMSFLKSSNPFLQNWHKTFVAMSLLKVFLLKNLD